LHQYLAVFESLNQFQVKYVVIGGIAVVIHAVPRATFDLDILIEPSAGNAEKLLQALQSAGIGTATLITPGELLQNEITVFQDFVRIDVQTSTPGITFEDAFSDCKIMVFQGRTINVISKHHLIQMKRAAGRKIDLEDVELLLAVEDD
jgi:hypothetical protein